jgi:hypothetical protein
VNERGSWAGKVSRNGRGKWLICRLVIMEETVNYYGSQEHIDSLKDYENRLFSKCTFDTPTREYALDEEYYVKSYNLVDESTCKPLHAPDSACINRLYRKQVLVFEWRYIGGHDRKASIFRHANGRTYLIFYENLYGYSVLDFSSMKTVNYIPRESAKHDEHFEETFIWMIPHYDPSSNLLAVEGCVWAAPYSIIVLDFCDPMRIIEANKWTDLDYDQTKDSYLEIYDEFKTWTPDALICTNGTVTKQEILEKMDTWRGYDINSK